MAASAPEVSVVIPTRDRWDLLSRTLAGALNQPGVEHEVVVVDDGSVDETPQRLAELRDPRLRVVRHSHPKQLAAARNAGISAARGKWLAFLDDDDLWSPRKLRAQLDAAIAGGAVFAFSAGLTVDESRSVLRTQAVPDPENLLHVLTGANAIPVGASNVLALTEVVRRLGGFDEDLKHFADWDLWIRLAAAGPAAACREPHVAYVLHAKNMVLAAQRGLVAEFRRLVAKHELAASDYGVAPDRIVPDRSGIFRWLGWANARCGRRVRAARWYLRSALGRTRYGRRRSLGDAVLAVRGETPEISPHRPPDAEILRGAGWLGLYR
jgi:glycosyltransferase involved in cell wall biosynthesis